MGKGGRKRGRETSMCERNIDWGAFCTPQMGMDPQPRHVP